MFEKKQYRMADMHCHIIPNVDDGSKDMEMSISMLKIAQSEGITDICVTPHFKAMHRNVPYEVLLDYIEDLKKEAEKENIFINLYPGQEVMYFSEMVEKLEDKTIIPLGNSKHVLVEFLPNTSYNYIRNAVMNIQAAGFVPVVAHVERYFCSSEDFEKGSRKVRNTERIQVLQNTGVKIQVNAGSIMGQLGSKIKGFTRCLLEEGLVDFIGTDAHSNGRRSPEVKKLLKYLYKTYEEEYVQDITYNNAMKLMKG